MTDYSKVPDYEINARVGESLGMTAHFIEHDGRVKFRDEKGRIQGTKDYCNNPADAWPIITDMRPNIIPERSKSGKWSIGVNIGKTLHEIDRKENNFTYVDANLLRGCMIVFLMMKDAEKC
ncbi:phage protein NinX family protein [Serratia marcescens]|uniref:phage protein NinX family protein n=1 Tax=Serratia marcescens TaxID=615 RepID=UPI00315B1B44